MQAVISQHTVSKWATDFVRKLQDIRERNEQLHKKLIETQNMRSIRKAYQKAAQRLLMLDYDGTLVGLPMNLRNRFLHPN